jgi:UDP-N-acetylmuramoyl-tripeptide--D-alanyl-D-alanine ligase
MSALPSLNQLPAVVDGQRLAAGVDDAVVGCSTDSRTIQPGELFVALRGESFDGHAFVTQVLEQGAVAAVVDRQFVPSAELPFEKLIQVDNTLTAYQQLGRWKRRQFSGPVVGITGSFGKTTTKELIAAALDLAGPTLRTFANYNNEIGVPRTLLGLDDQHRYAVIEMAMRGRGQIAELTQIAEPDIAIITTVGTAHIGLLGSREAIAQAKCELLEYLRPDRLAILNADNALLMETAQQVWSGRTVTYGLENGDLRGQLQDQDTLIVEGQAFKLPLSGEHNALNFLAVLAVARELGLPWSKLQTLQVELPGGRARRVELPNDILILDETYNAGFESMIASLKLLVATPGQRRIAVLGTMKELGDFSVPLHQEVGEMVAQLGLDELLILADPAEAAAMAQGAAGVPSQCFNTPEELAATLKPRLQAGDRVLCKASRAVALERVVQALQ